MNFKKLFKEQKLTFLFTLILLIGILLRFYKLDWGDNLYTHPDEYHIATSVSQLSFPNQMHPHFFSYGTVIIYIIYFTKELIAFLNSHNSLFIIHDSPFIIGRFYSALFSSITIIVIYFISRFFFGKISSLLPMTLVALTPGLIQQAHFSTPESTLIFFLFTSLLFLLHFIQNGKNKSIFFSSLFLGLALGVKISSIVFLFPLLIAIVLKFPKRPLRLLGTAIVSFVIIVGTLAIVAPFIFLDFPAFKGNLEYEGGLAAGTIQVFYTRQFIQTTPVLFQLEKIFPYALGPAVLFAGAGGFFSAVFILIKNRKQNLLIFIIAFLSIFIPNAFLFAKWTRFISPTFPFFSIFALFFIVILAKKNKILYTLFISILLITTITWTVTFFTIYTKPDIRTVASNWLVSNIPNDASILVEGGNTVDLPLYGNNKRVSLDFYALENDFTNQEKVIDGLYTSDYFFVQSRRVFSNHQRARKEFPKTAKLYDKLFAGNLGFEQIKEFHSFPSLEIGPPAGGWKLEIPDETAEETWSVFDHPVIRIFKKTKSFPRENYEKIFRE